MNKKSLKTGAVGLLSSVIMSACALPGLGSTGIEGEGIQVVTTSGTEMIILANIVSGMIEHYIDIDVELIQNMGSSTMTNQAIMGGDANITAGSYTGSAITTELGLEPSSDPEETERIVIEGFAEEYDALWFPSYGFENTYAFMVTQEVAEEYNLEKVSDLEEVADQMEVGVDDQWVDRPGDGYYPFIEHYGFSFQDYYSMQIGLVYSAVATGDMDVVLGYTTDGRIASYDLVVLEDDKEFFPPYDAANYATYEILEEYPELENILLKLEDTIDVETMQELNYVADDYLLEPATVAAEFLEANNYFEEKEPYVEPLEGGE